MAQGPVWSIMRQTHRNLLAESVEPSSIVETASRPNRAMSGYWAERNNYCFCAANSYRKAPLPEYQQGSSSSAINFSLAIGTVNRARVPCLTLLSATKYPLRQLIIVTMMSEAMSM